MFDSFYFEKGALPNNREPETAEFQTKCLDCRLDVYRVSRSGDVKIEPYYEKNKDKVLNADIGVYSIRWDGHGIIDKDTKGYYQDYDLKIRNNKVIEAKKVYENGYE